MSASRKTLEWDPLEFRGSNSKIDRVRRKIYKRSLNTLKQLQPDLADVKIVSCNWLIKETKRHLKIIEDKNDEIAREIADIKQQNVAMEQYIKHLNNIYDEVMAKRANEFDPAAMELENAVTLEDEPKEEIYDEAMAKHANESGPAVMESENAVTLEKEPKEENLDQ